MSLSGKLVRCSLSITISSPPKADPKRRGLSLLKTDGWKGHAGKPEFATQEEAQKIRLVQQS